MDTLSHGLWGGAVFGQRKDMAHAYGWAFLWGMMPDLLSFGPFFATHLPTIMHRWVHRGPMGTPDPRIIPPYVYHAYNVTHSLVIWAILFSLIWLVRKHCPWVFGAWALHILCDIPTHSIRFFPTPYLWPFHTPLVNGIPWGRPAFMLENYSAIALAYTCIALYKHWKRPE